MKCSLTIYADVVFLINFVMDSFILWLSGMIARRRQRPVFTILGGFVMALCYMPAMFLAGSAAINVIISAVALSLGVVIALRPAKFREFVKQTVITCVAAFAIGGMGMALFYFTNFPVLIGDAISYTVSRFSLKILIASSSSIYIAAKLLIAWQKRMAIKRRAFYPVRICCGERDAQFTALMDTGNSLRDPLGDCPVLIAEFTAVERFLPKSVNIVFRANKDCDIAEILNTVDDAPFMSRARVIPFSSLGKQNGMLLGFRPDYIEITNDDRSITLDNVVVGVYSRELSGDGTYHGLLSPEFIKVS
ncbi:MAG: sigma-E processing peptidase SpoIIGA [Clostridiales bacterium]|nr:sigma-E processing peptidase SpoIIGA [Clostridiales bacterium]